MSNPPLYGWGSWSQVLRCWSSSLPNGQPWWMPTFTRNKCNLLFSDTPPTRHLKAWSHKHSPRPQNTCGLAGQSPIHHSAPWREQGDGLLLHCTVQHPSHDFNKGGWGVRSHGSWNVPSGPTSERWAQPSQCVTAVVPNVMSSQCCKEVSTRTALQHAETGGRMGGFL